MSTDEYSQDMPDDLYLPQPQNLHHHQSQLPQRSGSASSYPNLGSSSSCSLPMPSNLDLMQMSTAQMQQQQQQQLLLEQEQLETTPVPGQRQKRKYTRRKHPEERKKRGPRTKDLNAPRMPLNGYVRFLNANRERVKQENPELTFAEVTKRLASEWSSMSNDEKKAYLDEAEKAKEMYLKELHDYQQTDSYQEFMNMKERAKQQQQPAIDQQSMSSPQMVPSPQSQASQQMPAQGLMHPSLMYPASTPSPHYYSEQNQQQSMQYSSPMYQQSQQQQHQNSYSPYNMNGSTNKYSSSCMSSSNGQNGPYSNPSSYYSGANSMSQSQASYNAQMQYQQQQQRGYLAPGNGISAHQMGTSASAASNLGLNNPMIADRSGGIAPGSMPFQSILDQCDSVVDLPIFTEEFLEHNKMREQELRNYRALTQEYEEENAILSKHVDDIKLAVDKLSADEAREIETNGRLRNVFDRLQQNLVDCFHDISIPTNESLMNQPGASCQYDQQQQMYGPPTTETMDQFMTGLNKLRMNPCKNNDSLIQSIRSAVTSLDEVAF